MTPGATAVSDYCLAALLRAHRSPQGQGWQSSASNATFEEREELLLRWALSDPVMAIASHVAEHPRDIRSAIAFETQTYSGEIPGAVDARASLFEQELRGDSTLYVVSEPAVSPLTRRNHVLAWVLREAESMILAAIRRHKLEPDQVWIHDRAGLIERATRSRLLREVMLSPTGRRRPVGAAVRDASKSLSPLYRMAAKAFIAFEAVERMDADAIKDLMSSTLVAKLEDWQQFELATGLAAAEALAEASGERLRWKGSIAGGSEILYVGRYRVHWQRALSKRPESQLDPSEALIARTAEALNAGLGRARSDISVRDTVSGLDIAHLECKWFGSSQSAPSAIVDAISQLVRYCRDSRPEGIEEAEALLKDCVVALSTRSGYKPSLDGSGPICLADFADLVDGGLGPWAERLHNRVAALTLAA